MARNRTRDPSDLGAFLSGAQRRLPLSLLRYHANFFLDTKRAASAYRDASNAIHLDCDLH